MSRDTDLEIVLRKKADDGWVAIHGPTGAGARGDTREEALAELDEAVALHRGTGGTPVEDEDAFLRALGIDPGEVEPIVDLPEFIE